MTITPARLDHDYPFDPTFGYTLDDLLAVGGPEEPADFVDFWRATYERAMRIELNLAHRRIDSPWPGVELFEVEYDSWDGVRIGGWMTRPADGGDVKRGVVIGHGYGGRADPVLDTLVTPQATIQPCARGFHRSAHPDLPDTSQRHVVTGIGSRDTYIHRGCVVDYWLAASALIELVPGAADHLHYHGGSFGGGIGAMMLPWDARFERAFLRVPSFGPHPLRVTLPGEGSGKAVTAHYQRDPSVLDVLRYYDSVLHARHIRIPVMVQCALFDPKVPPPGQFAVYNAIPGDKRLVVVRAGHFDYDAAADDRRVDRALREWFAIR